MVKKKSASSRPEKRVPAGALFMAPLTETERRQLKKLAIKPDSQIDFSDAPQLKGSVGEGHIGRFYRPIKRLVSIRVDADVLDWFRGRGKRYQTYMNEVLRQEMRTHRQVR